MTAPLTVHNASIRTAVVEIKTLTVSGKQVTLAVFRQLRNEPLIAHDGTLNGVPWGVVNYHPDKCGDDNAAHWHVVWQRGAELLRARIGQEYRPGNWGDDALDAFYDVCCAAHLHGELPERWFDGNPIPKPLRGETWHSQIAWHGTLCGVPTLAIARESVRDAANYRDRESYLKAMDEDLRPLTGPGPAARVIDRLWGIVEAKGHAEAARRKRHADVRKAISDLPQLFIAV